MSIGAHSVVALLILLLVGTVGEVQADAPVELTVNDRTDPLGVDLGTDVDGRAVLAPRLAWINTADRRGWRQSAYHILIASSRALLDRDQGDVWDSGRVESSAQRVVFAGRPLRSETIYHWKVRVVDDRGEVSAWSEPATFETALLGEADWGDARWVHGEMSLMRQEFQLDADRKIDRARAYVTGQGLVELHLNGAKVGHDVVSPAVTHYHERALYMVYDITERLRAGERTRRDNAVGLRLAHGFWSYDPDYGNYPEGPFYMNARQRQPRARLRLVVRYTDGTSDVVGTHAGGDDPWTGVRAGPIVFDHAKDGEHYDARRELPGWSSPGFGESQPQRWRRVSPVTRPPARTTVHAQPLRITETIKPVSIVNQGPDPQTGQTRWLADFGVNFVGGVRLAVRGPRGTTITMKHSEKLLPDGTIDMRMTYGKNAVLQTNRYTLKGEQAAGGRDEVWQPAFCYLGGRYVEITGWPQPGGPDQRSITGLVFHSDYDRDRGSFACANVLLNDIHVMIRRTFRGNSMGVPTDTPVYEKLGWMADAMVISEPAMFNFGLECFYRKWMADHDDAQVPPADAKFGGQVPSIIPGVGRGAGNELAWMAATCVTPFELYKAYGDRWQIEKDYPRMIRFIDGMTRLEDDHHLVMQKTAYADWMSADHPPTPRQMVSNMYYYRAADLTARAAAILDRPADEQRRYRAIADRIRAGINRRWYVDGQYGPTATGDALALAFGVAPDADRPAVFARLVEKFERSRHPFQVLGGVVGNKPMYEVLRRMGRSDLAYRAVTAVDEPALGYMLRQGATTTWEAYHDRTRSRNHVALGAGPAMFLYRGLAGIDQRTGSAGYVHSIVRPTCVYGELRSAAAATRTPFGELAVDWRRDDEPDGSHLHMKVTVPVNTRCDLDVPLPEHDAVITEDGTVVWSTHGRREAVEGLHFVRVEDGYAVFEAGGGTYRLTVTPQARAK